jgi:hypothetical protein
MNTLLFKFRRSPILNIRHFKSYSNLNNGSIPSNNFKNDQFNNIHLNIHLTNNELKLVKMLKSVVKDKKLGTNVRIVGELLFDIIIYIYIYYY